MAVEALYSTKKEPPGAATNPGSSAAQQFYNMPVVQDVNYPTNKISTPSWVLDSLNRSIGRLLAHSYCTEQASLLGLPLQGSELSISRAAIRPQRGAARVYESNGTRSKTTSRSGDLVSSLSGRLSYSCPNEGRMYPGLSKSFNNHEEHGIVNKREQVKTHTSSEIRMAGNTMGSPIIQSTSSRRKIQMPSDRPTISGDVTNLHKKNGDESTRPLQLDWPKRLYHTSSHVYDANNLKVLLKEAPRLTNSNSEELEDATLRLDEHEVFPSTFGVTEAGYHHTVRCYATGLGLPNTQQVVKRLLRQVNELFNKCQRTNSDLVCASSGHTKERNHRGPLRQPVSHSCTKERRVDDIPSIFPGRADLEESSSLQLETQHISHRRDIQRSGRPTVQKHTFINRVDSLVKGFSENSQTKQSYTGGSFCYSSQQQTSRVCITMPRPEIKGRECISSSVGQVGSSVHVPTDTTDFEGFESDDAILIQNSNTRHTRDTNETLVHETSPTRNSVDLNRSNITANRSRQSSGTNKSYTTSRVAVIRTAYQTRFQSCQRTIGLLTSPIRQSSINDYQIKWEKFCSFLTARNIAPNQLTLANVLDFFSYLFFEKKLRPNTVSHYRSALSVPLGLEFGINLRDPAVSHLIKAMQIERPASPASNPAWSLNKVLHLLDTWGNDIALDRHLQKTAFLLLLATGWRISELHACVRATEFCSISQDLILQLRPHPSFLAKNECPQKRWSHKIIPALRLSDGTISNLCPVHALAEYLRRTSRTTTGSLIIHPSTRKPLSKQQLSNYICKLINEADSSGPARVHDIRKYAASCSLAETMDVTGMIDALQWKSPQTFYKFYMSPTPPLAVPATLPFTRESHSRVRGVRLNANTPEEGEFA